ncbi:MAG: ECF transporter S component [Clostridium sp.]
MEKIGSTKSLIFTALGIAIVAVCTMIIKLPVPATGGYINFGDTMVFTFAILLGRKKGAVIGGIGSCLADLLMGYMIFAPATLVIKGIEGFICGLLYEKISKRNNSIGIVVGSIVAGTFMVGGYFIYETLIFSFEAASISIVGNIIQGVVSVVISVPVSIMIKKATKNQIEEKAA